MLLTDLHMPEMDGYALAKAIRSEESQGHYMPIIALTANALRDQELRCRAAGMDAYLTKPVRLSRLKATIEDWLVPEEPSLAPPAPARPAARVSVVADLKVLESLVGDDPEVIGEVLVAFRASAAQSSAALREGVVAGAVQRVADAAHKLKSAALSIGAQRLGDICSDMEETALAGKAEDLDPRLLEFLTELDAVYRFLDAR